MRCSMIKRLLFGATVLLTVPFGSHAQFSFQYNDDIPVIRSGDTLENPWAGGLNYIQMSDFDFDQDGDMDLFCFDRSSDNIRVFTKEWDGNDYFYNYVHNAKALFPSGLRYRVQLVDFDLDGRKDLFTWGIGGGLTVYRNVSDVTNGLQWTLFKSNLYSDYAINGNAPLFVSTDDLPALVDVDDDGDLDVLTSDASGLRMEYHQNQSIQLYGTADSLVFVQKNECWGKFTEGMTNFTINLNDPNPPCVGGNIPNPERSSSIHGPKKLHAGTTTLCIDIDSSGVKDLIMGDAAYTGLTLLTNGGTMVNADSPITSFDDVFPAYSTPIKCQNFPGAFYIDVNDDQNRDLIVSPNTFINSLDRESVIYYQNIGTDAVPVFTPSTDNFLQSEMIEHGTGSIPVLFDYNGDGLEDLLVANFYNYKAVADKESLIALYYNVGTATAPVFQFIDIDAFNLTQENFGIRCVPTFGDIDGDGDQDMFLGLENGTIAFYENLAVGATPIWAPPVTNYTDNQPIPINVNAYAHPQLFDLNNDGLLDLLIGNRLGTIAYYENVGTSNNPSFELNNATLGEVDILPGNQSSNASIHFFRENGETYLFCGAFNGTLSYYDDIDNNLNLGDSFNLVSNTYQGIDVGQHSSVFTLDIDQDGNRNLFLGQDLGGLHHYDIAFDSTANLQENESLILSLFPNPTEGSFTISSLEPIEKVNILNTKGQIIESFNFDQTNVMISTEHFPAGMYYVSIQVASGRIGTKKVIIR